MNLAIDISNYSTIPTVQQIECLKQSGYTKVIVGCSYGTVAGMQLAACAQGGLDVEAYAWIDFDRQWQVPLDRALAVIEGKPVRRIWLDAEGNTFSLTPTQVVARIEAAIRYVNAKRDDLIIGIYTGAWWWKPKTGDSDWFRTLPLWMANYVQDPDTPPSGQPALCGGWREAALWQYAGTIQTCGLNTDRNVILEEDALTPQQMAELKAHVDGRFLALIKWIQDNLPLKDK